MDGLQALGGAVIASSGSLELRHVRTLERPLSLIAWVEARAPEALATIVIKVPGARVDDDPRALEKSRLRYAEEDTNLRRLASIFAGTPALSVVRPVACLPVIPALATMAVSGINLRDRITRGARWPAASGSMARLEEATKGAGRWLAELRRRTTVPEATVSLDEMAAYVDVRLKRLLPFGRRGIDEAMRRRALLAFERAAALSGRLDRTVCTVHGDLALSNIVWGEQGTTVLDVSSLREGSRYLDPARVHHQLGLYSAKLLYSPRTISRLREAFWRGYGETPGEDDPMLVLHLLQHTLTHWLGRLKVAPAGPMQALYDGWVRDRHREALERLLRQTEGWGDAHAHGTPRR